MVNFNLLPVLDTMIDFYKKPLNADRFQDYLNLMSPCGRELVLPITAYNPMAKEHILAQLETFKALNTEGVMQSIISKVNGKIGNDGRVIQVSMVLADDLKGGWTNRTLTDYGSKFGESFNQLKRPFCTPIFWSGEDITFEKIETRIEEYLWRTVFQIEKGFNITLLHFLEQEAYVKQKMGIEEAMYEEGDLVQELFETHKASTSEPFILAFLYGDEAAARLGHRSIGAFEDMGFLMARQLVK